MDGALPSCRCGARQATPTGEDTWNTPPVLTSTVALLVRIAPLWQVEQRARARCWRASRGETACAALRATANATRVHHRDRRDDMTHTPRPRRSWSGRIDDDPARLVMEVERLTYKTRDLR